MAKTGKRQPAVNGTDGRRPGARPVDAMIEPVMGSRGTTYGFDGAQASSADPAGEPAEADRLQAEETQLAESLLAGAHLNDPFLDGRALPDSYLDTGVREAYRNDPYRNDTAPKDPYRNDVYPSQTLDIEAYANPGFRDPYELPDPLVGGFTMDELRAALAAAERPADADVAWARTLRRLARYTVWALPVSAIVLAVSAAWGWPTPASEGDGKSPGTWLVVTLLGLLLATAGALAVTALLTATRAAPWSLVGLGLVLAGTVALAPVLGLIGLARPVATRLSGPLGPNVHADLESRFFDGAVTRWLGVGGLVLLAVGWLAVAIAVLGSGVLNRLDGSLLVAAIAVAGTAAYTHWQFLLVIAAMLALAAGLGLAWTASRLTPDGAAPLD